MTFRPLLLSIALLVCGCSVAPVGTLPRECSGVPGDFRTPNAMLEPGAATHGPGTNGQPVELNAVARPWPGLGGAIPLLYIYDPVGDYVFGSHSYEKLLTDPAFVQVENEAYWGEIVDNRYYLVPQLDKCSQASLLGAPISFRAPPKGIMFMQYLTSGCTECAHLTKAIEDFIASNPDMPVRWVRVSVPGSIGSLRK